jgi:nucleotidyltransferase/DNA polymerase involved in DNA repair
VIYLILVEICADQNKPDDQFYLEGDREKIIAFMNDLHVRKVPGIGRVTERVLHEIGVFKWKNLLDHTESMWLAFSERSCSWLLRSSLGIAPVFRGVSQPRKSISVERTFSPTSSVSYLEQKCSEIVTKLADKLKAKGISGRCVTLKLKDDSFRLKSRSLTVNEYMQDSESILNVATSLLRAEFPLSLRLMGVRMSNLRTSET